MNNQTLERKMAVDWKVLTTIYGINAKAFAEETVGRCREIIDTCMVENRELTPQEQTTVDVLLDLHERCTLKHPTDTIFMEQPS